MTDTLPRSATTPPRAASKCRRRRARPRRLPLAAGSCACTNTEVPPALEGRGIAGAMVKAALAHCAGRGLRVEPACSYVRAYMKRHPDTHDLLVER